MGAKDEILKLINTEGALLSELENDKLKATSVADSKMKLLSLERKKAYISGLQMALDIISQDT